MVGRFIESTDDAYVGGDITVIAPKVVGFIAEVSVTDNQAVHADDLLVRLDDRDYLAALAKATAAVAAQQATLANLDATRRLQEAMIAQARAEVAAALKQLWSSLTWREAQVQTYADAFLTITVCFVIATAMVPLLRKVALTKAPRADAH